VTWPFVDLSGCSVVLVEHAAEELSSADPCVDGDDRSWVEVRRVLVEALVWVVGVEVAFVPGEHGRGVSFVVARPSVGALVLDAADEAFGVAVRSRSPG
jgi:hypothetical protein